MWPRSPFFASCANAASPCKKYARVLRFLQKELGKRLVETVKAASEYHLLTDGRHIYLEDSARGVVDLLKNARQPMLTVCLSDAIQRVLDPTGAREQHADGLQGRLSAARERFSSAEAAAWRRIARRRQAKWFRSSS